MTGRILGALGALAIATTPVAAHAADASKLSLAPAAAQDEGSGEGGGASTGIIAGALGVGIIAIAALGLTVGDDDFDGPVSN